MKYIFKNDFVFSFIRCAPRIGLRFLTLLFSRKQLTCSNFRADSYYALKGSLNQLLWQVENSVFITLSNSPHIFFDSGQLLFNVTKEQSQFELTVYGVNRKIKVQTQIKIVPIEKFEFDNIALQLNTTTIDFTKSRNSANIHIKPNATQYISFQHSLLPKEIKKIKINLNHTNFIKTNSAKLLNTTSIQEVNNLKALIESTIDNL